MVDVDSKEAQKIYNDVAGTHLIFLNISNDKN